MPALNVRHLFLCLRTEHAVFLFCCLPHAVSAAFLQAAMDGKEMKKFILDAENGKFIHRIE